jgi:hypothetical protein
MTEKTDVPQVGNLISTYCIISQYGQMMERINWMADRSEKGLRQSGGIMVNYVYR